MENGSNSPRRTVEGGGLTFVRRAPDGRTLSETELSALALTNDTITRVVSSVSRRIVAAEDGSFDENIVTG